MTAAQLNIIEFILGPRQCGYSQNLVELIRDLQQTDAEQLAEFVRCFVDDVICRQILPHPFV